MKTITLDLERMTSVPALHKYLRSALALPVYYGANLDALYDCLTEIAEPTQIIVPADITDNEKLGWYGEQLLQVLQESGYHYSKAAAQLGISRTTLWNWLKEMNNEQNEQNEQ